ncbi:MAG: DUF1127 domain-containing protein [Burkholderiales bacterium]
MNQALNISPATAFGAAEHYTLRRARGETPAAHELHRRARAARSRGIAKLVAIGVESTHNAISRALDSYRAYRDARDTIRVLRGLDDRTLHDLGYHRSEIESVAIEIHVARAR